MGRRCVLERGQRTGPHQASPQRTPLCPGRRKGDRASHQTAGIRAIGGTARRPRPVPASCRICQTVEAAIGWPSLTSSPCTRRCPQVGFRSRCGSRACGSRLPWTPPGTPAVRRPSARHQPTVQASSVAGVTANTSPTGGGEPIATVPPVQPVTRLVKDPANLAAQDRVLVPDHQRPDILGRRRPGSGPSSSRAGSVQGRAGSVNRKDHSATTEPASLTRPDPVIEPHRAPYP